MSYFPSIGQNVVADANNTTSTPINSGAWWAGLASSSLGIVGIQLMVKADQDATIYIDQAPAGMSAGVGTATITGTNTLNGTLTKFTRDLHIGDVIVFDPLGTPQTLTITSITSDTQAGVSTASNVGVAKAFNQYYWDVNDSYQYKASINNFGVTVQAVGSYLRVRVQNISASNQTYFRVATALCPIVEAVPRSLDAHGHLQTAVEEISDEYGFQVENTPMGEMRTVSPVRLAGSTFDGSTVDPNFWNVVNTNGGTVTQSSATAQLQTNTTANGATLMYSVRKARYVGGSSMVYRTTIRFNDTGTANNKRRFGVGLIGNYTLTISSASVVAGDVYTNNGQQFQILKTETTTTATAFGTGNPGAGAQTYTRVSGTGPASLTGSNFAAASVVTDGAWFQLDGTTFSVVTAKRGTELPVNSGSFNGTIGATYEPGVGVVTYEIYWTSSKVYFAVGGETLHTFSATSTAWTSSMNMFLFADNVNSSGSTSNVIMYSRVASIRRLGPLETESIYRNLTTATTYNLKWSAGRLKTITVNNCNLNAGALTLYDSFAASTGAVIATIQIPKNAALTPFTLHYNLPFHYGLTAVLAVAGDVTITYE